MQFASKDKNFSTENRKTAKFGASDLQAGKDKDKKNSGESEGDKNDKSIHKQESSFVFKSPIAGKPPLIMNNSLLSKSREIHKKKKLKKQK